MRKIKPKEMDRMEEPTKAERKKIYPEFRIELDFLPEAKKWEIGKTYQISLELKQVGLRIDRFGNDATFEIHGIKVHNSKGDKKVPRYKE